MLMFVAILLILLAVYLFVAKNPILPKKWAIWAGAAGVLLFILNGVDLTRFFGYEGTDSETINSCGCTAAVKWTRDPLGFWTSPESRQGPCQTYLDELDRWPRRVEFVGCV